MPDGRNSAVAQRGGSGTRVWGWWYAFATTARPAYRAVRDSDRVDLGIAAICRELLQPSSSSHLEPTHATRTLPLLPFTSASAAAIFAANSLTTPSVTPETLYAAMRAPRLHCHLLGRRFARQQHGTPTPSTNGQSVTVSSTSLAKAGLPVEQDKEPSDGEQLSLPFHFSLTINCGDDIPNEIFRHLLPAILP
ncbi:hypothetical protein DAEQUDRAFT_758094 [Daedalea quercina L-15889]|uniref:Uncharacterized protein n=1 Tax=Daedalea quercina L-15889 TaxID=1314783 RepID=A0A165NYC5_9APHY|nr:hypothetical protein DAEQUDRAFT_758094 [Daedalea quercina L-15889]